MSSRQWWRVVVRHYTRPGFSRMAKIDAAAETPEAAIVLGMQALGVRPEDLAAAWASVSIPQPEPPTPWSK